MKLSVVLLKTDCLLQSPEVIFKLLILMPGPHFQNFRLSYITFPMSKLFVKCEIHIYVCIYVSVYIYIYKQYIISDLVI